MYSKKKIEEKCYELNPSLKEDGLSITVIEEPKKGGHTIAIYKEINKAPTKDVPKFIKYSVRSNSLILPSIANDWPGVNTKVLFRVTFIAPIFIKVTAFALLVKR